MVVTTVRAIMGLGTKVYVLEDVPYPNFDVPRLVAITSMRNGDLERLGLSKEKYCEVNCGLRETFDQITHIGATMLDPCDYFTNRNNIYGVIKNGQLLFCDRHHLSVEGAAMLAPLFEPILRNERGQIPH